MITVEKSLWVESMQLIEQQAERILRLTRKLELLHVLFGLWPSIEHEGFILDNTEETVIFNAKVSWNSLRLNRIKVQGL